MDYDQAVKNGEIFFGWSTWMEQDGYAPVESVAFDFENGRGTYTYQGKIAGSFDFFNQRIIQWIIRQNRIQIILRISFIVLSRIVKLQFKLSMINGKTCFMLRVYISHIIRDNHKQYARKNVTVFYMAMANVTGNPKRTIGTILTMGFSCVLFVIISWVLKRKNKQ